MHSQSGDWEREVNAFPIRRLGTRGECVPNQEIGNDGVNSLNAFSIKRLGTRCECVPNQEMRL